MVFFQPFHAHLTLNEGRLRPGQVGLVGTRIDFEQQLALLDHLAVLEMDLDEMSRRPGLDVHRIDRLGLDR